MSLLSVARGHSRRQVATARAAADAVRRLWSGVDPAAVVRSWTLLLPHAVQVVTAAQLVAAGDADTYTDAALAAQGIESAPVGAVNAHALAGVASDGRALESLLVQPMLRSLARLTAGQPPRVAMAGGLLELDMMVRTQVADAGRVADGLATVARRNVHGYVRLLVPPSCSRCVVLAGRYYRWNAGFQRHPRCDCRHVPASEDAAGDLRSDPKAYFASLSQAEQDRAFTRAGAQAIRDGADMGKVVNARRGALGLTPAGARITEAEARALRGGRDRGRLQEASVFGRQEFVTTEGTTTRGTAGRRLGARQTGRKTAGDRYRRAQPPRLMPESIYRIAGDDRDEAIRLLRRFGYITG